MGILTPKTMKLIAHELYDYELTDDDARAIAHGAGALLTNSHHIAAILNLDGVEPPFGYPNLDAEASRIRTKKA